MSADNVVDWVALRKAAQQAATNAYAPWSRLHVGAAALTEQGSVVSGCNVENASFGLSLCAECGLVSALRAGGAERLLAVSVVTEDGRPLTPCGRCRQLLLEHGGPELPIDGGQNSEPVALGQLLPAAFDASELSRRQP
ncbi:MAG TPA: cytidine deaminase [Candidatus Dormibacteraeota bacterium]|nr:cytidine deaminase [Candidatus Dormibacteraeota bacterium]